MIGRLVQTADFKRLLAVPPQWRSAHFAIHHLPEAPARRERPDDLGQGVQEKLSTGDELLHPHTVDESHDALPGQRLRPRQAASPTVSLSGDRWLGCVVPKRQARRAVTRSLIKREIRSAAQAREATMAGGLWLVRLRQGFPVAEYRSASSSVLRQALREELRKLFDLTSTAVQRSQNAQQLGAAEGSARGARVAGPRRLGRSSDPLNRPLKRAS